MLFVLLVNCLEHLCLIIDLGNSVARRLRQLDICFVRAPVGQLGKIITDVVYRDAQFITAKAVLRTGS